MPKSAKNAAVGTAQTANMGIQVQVYPSYTLNFEKDLDREQFTQVLVTRYTLTTNDKQVPLLMIRNSLGIPHLVAFLPLPLPCVLFCPPLPIDG